MLELDSQFKKARLRKGLNEKMADGVHGLMDGVGGFFGCNGWLMFLIFVLLVIGCGGCFGGGCI
jgi:phage shock protein PspC (stress-responsive transcriptional regulator)